MKEGGREGETKSHRLKRGRGHDYRDERLNEASEQSKTVLSYRSSMSS